MYHYLESGLDNIYLVDGFRMHNTAYGEGVSIHDTDGLHRLIGNWLVQLPNPLSGAALRFLRIEMDLSQRRLGELLGSSEQAVRRWEKAKASPISGPADRLMRVIYNEYTGHNGPVRELVERLSHLDQIDAAQARFEEADGGWKIAA